MKPNITKISRKQLASQLDCSYSTAKSVYKKIIDAFGVQRSYLTQNEIDEYYCANSVKMA